MEKPVECSNCTKECTFIYKQLRSASCQEEGMCQDCPSLKKRLQGQHDASLDHASLVACKDCHTFMHEVLSQDVLGCALCYEVFHQAICQRLNLEILDYKQDIMLKNDSFPSSEQLLKLSKDLQEAVLSENFEKAALLRDEINKLKKMMGG